MGFGGRIAIVRDVTGDGVHDLAVSSGGAVLLFSGGSGAIHCTMTDPDGASLHGSLADIGDVTGDGISEVAAGAPGDAPGGSVAVFSGAGCTFVRKLTDPEGVSGDSLGIAVIGFLDVTGDGVPEVVAGAYLDDTEHGTDTGSVLLFSGASGALVWKTDAEIAGGSYLGFSLDRIADLDADGMAEVVAGAPRDDLIASDAGSVVVLSGSSGAVVRWVSDPSGAASDWLGASVAVSEDMNGDDVPEILAGAYLADDGPVADCGRVVVFSGADGVPIRRLTDPDRRLNDRLGRSVAAPGDVDGDGVPDVLAGAEEDDPSEKYNAGSALLFSGSSGALVQRFVDPDGVTLDSLGFPVLAVPDLSGDGRTDFVTGARGDEPSGEDHLDGVGAVVVFSLDSDCDGDGSSPFAGDCDDTDAARGPARIEVCDGRDNDCDWDIDEDEDGDGYDKCDDCLEPSAEVHPGAAERCNGVDDDCDGETDEGLDADGDGFHAPCDCVDDDPELHPGVAETCNHRDDDCDGQADTGWTVSVTARKLRDSEGLAGDWLGSAVAVIGDVTGDGIDDIAAGARYDTTPAGLAAGSVVVFSGADGTPVCRMTDPGGSPTDYLGWEVAALGDVSWDGVPDVAAGAVHDEPPDQPSGNHGSVVIFSGATCLALRKLTDPDAAPGDVLGGSISAIGDVTSDGVGDIVVGALGDDTDRGVEAGSVLVFSGANGSLVYKVTGGELVFPDDELGHSVAGIGDVDLDGVPDFAAGLPFDNTSMASNSGSVLVFSGADGRVLRKLVDPAGGSDELGVAVAGVGDIDGDDVPDIAAGSSLNDAEGVVDRGSVIVFSGHDGAVIRRLRDPLGGHRDRLGTTVAAVPDVTGDGVSEILAGVPGADTAAGADAGRAVLFSGSSGLVVQRLTDPDGAAGDSFGSALAVASDLTGDGDPEVIIGSHLDEPIGAGASDNVGSLLVFSSESDCDDDGLSRFDDCDDADAAVRRAPTETRDLRWFEDKRHLTWTPPLDPGGTGPLEYDALRSMFAPSFDAQSLCLEVRDGTDLEAMDDEVPVLGSVFYYLVRAVNACPAGLGSLGLRSDGTERAGHGCQVLPGR